MKYILILFLVSFSISVNSQPFTFVFLNKKEQKTEMPKDQLDKLMEGHMANIKRLANEGKLIAAGPFDGGGGIFVFKSDSREEVKTWLSTDPGVKAERWTIEIFPYQAQRGGVCSVGEKYEMTNYVFVRYNVNLTKYTINGANDLVQEHEKYVSQADPSQVIAQGSFGPQEGGILVLKDESLKEWIAKDPAVQKGLLEFDMKKLYIARGAFCEK